MDVGESEQMQQPVRRDAIYEQPAQDLQESTQV